MPNEYDHYMTYLMALLSKDLFDIFNVHGLYIL